MTIEQMKSLKESDKFYVAYHGGIYEVTFSHFWQKATGKFQLADLIHTTDYYDIDLCFLTPQDAIDYLTQEFNAFISRTKEQYKI